MAIPKRVWKIAAIALSAILYAVTLISAYGGYMNPTRYTLPSMALLFFPYFATLTLLVSAVWLICRKYAVGCIGIAALLACGPTFTEAVPFRFTNSPSEQSKVFKMVTFNCLHLTDQKNPDARRSRSLEFLINSGADFICLQELISFEDCLLHKETKSQLDSLLKIYPYYSNDPHREVKFLSKHPFEPLNIRLDDGFNYSHNFCGYRLKVDGRTLTVVNVHLPSFRLSGNDRNIITDLAEKQGASKSLKQFEGSVYAKMESAFKYRAKVSKYLAEAIAKIEDPIIICGDFNDVPGSWSYRTFVKEGFSDAYANTGFGYLVTYNQHLMWFHIDQILYRGDLMPLWVKKGRLNASDHYPIEAEFEFL